eukprot:2890838-Ditylum_brightwellii.AAC.1
MGDRKWRALLETDLKFQHPSGLDQLTINANAAHATGIKSWRSIGGHVEVMTAAAITYSTKWHHTLSTSLTEAEFIQETSTAMMAK